MKRLNFTLAFLFNMIVGIVLMAAVGMPALGLLFGAFAFLPLPQGVFGENLIPGSTDETEKEKALLSKIQDSVKKLLDEKNKGFITEDLLNLKLEAFTKSIDEIKEQSKNTPLFQKNIDEIYKEIELLKDSGSVNIFETREQAIQAATKALTESESFKNWVDAGCKGETAKINVKYALSSGRTGTVLISNQSNVVSDPHEFRTLYMRDVLPNGMIEQPYLVHDKVTSFTRPALGISENADALEVTMTTEEKTTAYKRIAIFIDMSKMAMKAVKWVQGYLNRRMPEDIKEQEDFQILFGDGLGNNVDGLFKNATLLNLSGASFSAGAIASVATYDGGAKTIVTFTAAHGLNNGLKITFASATATGYNNPFAVNVRTDKSIVIDTAYVAEADTSAWTATTKYGNYNRIDNATEIDVLNAAKAVQRVGRYAVTLHVMNPIDASIIESIKETTGAYIQGKAIRTNGVLYIDGIPVVETDAMKQGWGMSLDARNVAELLEFTSLSVYAMSDATLEKANKVRVFANEEIVFPIYNPFLATYYNFATVKTALETP